MSLKLFILFTTCVFLTYGDDVERKDNVESYITKEAAKELRNKLSAQGTQQDYDYDEILKKIIMSVQQPDDSPEQIVHEKKYFDYLPNDLDSEDVTNEDSTKELFKSYDRLKSSVQESEEVGPIKNQKFKRDLTSHNSRQRRQKYPAASPTQSRYSTETSHNPNPWNPQNNSGKFHPPHNHYLPALRPGVNNPDPPHNPMQSKPVVDLGNRVGGFEGDDSSQRIWEVNDINTGSAASFPAQFLPEQRPRPVPTTTRRPAGALNALDSNETPELEIEYPPDTFEGPLTTRAPLKKVTIKSNKSPSRKNVTRQKDRGNGREASTTTTRPTTASTVTKTPQLISTAGSRRVNTSVPNCVLAIVNCCSRYDEIVRTPCFEKYNCAGAFFGRSPCSPDIKAAAFREVEKFSQ